jgi:hypothetical protein
VDESLRYGERPTRTAFIRQSPLMRLLSGTIFYY